MVKSSLHEINLDELHKIPLLKALSEQHSVLLNQSAHERSFRKKECIFTPEKQGDFILIVLKGKVRIYLGYPDGKEFTIAFLEPGDVYSSHSGTFAEAMERTICWTIDIREFRSFMLQDPVVLISMIKVLGESLGNTLGIIENLVFRDVGKRLASFLLQAAKEKGQNSEQGTLVNLDLTVEEIASAVGTSRQTASLFLNRWQKAEILILSRKSIIIRDIPSLQNCMEEN
jgi:CRP-like cAMP-binding protein